MFTEPIAEHVWRTKYRLAEHGQPVEATIHDTWRRVAQALAAPEPHRSAHWRRQFEHALAGFRFLPGGRILAGAGAHRRATLFNCFVMAIQNDSLGAIFAALGESMQTLQEGGGIGCDFSVLRPAGMPAAESGNIASGPVSFMHSWNEACSVISSTGMRRGAMMATLRCDHPDIERFIDAKRESNVLKQFNLSVLVSDDFMRAVREGEAWPLVFPLAGRPAPDGAVVVERIWSGSTAPEPCAVLRSVDARWLWQHVLRAAFDCGDPGMIFIDRVQRANNLRYREHISATNPCGEVPLPAYGACNLGSINLARFVDMPFSRNARLDLTAIAASAASAVRMLDNVYEISHFPLKRQEQVARASRRIGIGITGLADAFAMLGVRYGSEASIAIADEVMRTICHAAYGASAQLAQERGAFPVYQAESYLAGEFVRSLPPDIRAAIGENGIRNSHLTAIAPAGSISLLANNVSSGIEPIYAFEAERNVTMPDGSIGAMRVNDYAWTLFRKLHGPQAPLPQCFVEAYDIDPVDQLKLQAQLQASVDQSISKTINLPTNVSFDSYRDLYMQAYRLGLKGCTVFRQNAATGCVLVPACGNRTDGICRMD